MILVAALVFGQVLDAVSFAAIAGGLPGVLPAEVNPLVHALIGRLGIGLFAAAKIGLVVLAGWLALRKPRRRAVSMLLAAVMIASYVGAVSNFIALRQLVEAVS